MLELLFDAKADASGEEEGQCAWDAWEDFSVSATPFAVSHLAIPVVIACNRPPTGKGNSCPPEVEQLISVDRGGAACAGRSRRGGCAAHNTEQESRKNVSWKSNKSLETTSRRFPQQ